MLFYNGTNSYSYLKAKSNLKMDLKLIKNIKFVKLEWKAKSVKQRTRDWYYADAFQLKIETGNLTNKHQKTEILNWSILG